MKSAYLGCKFNTNGCSFTVFNAKRTNESFRKAFKSTHPQTFLYTKYASSLEIVEGETFILTRLPSPREAPRLVDEALLKKAELL